MRYKTGSFPAHSRESAFKKITLTLLCVSGMVLVVSMITTQYLAMALRYPVYFGTPVFGQFYLPWSWVAWVWSFWSLQTDTMQRALVIFTSGSTISLVLYAMGIFMTSRKPSSVEGLHGTAHWADQSEIQNSGLLALHDKQPKKGVYVGAWKNHKTGKTHYLKHDGPEHVLAFAPTRSGKGVGLVLPTLLSWKGSVLCYDIKGENWALTAGWRKKYAGNKVMKFDPTAIDDSGVAFNPLQEIRIGSDYEVGDAQNVATMLVDTDGKGLSDHWSKTSHALLTSSILHCCYQILSEEKRCATLADVGGLLANPEMTIEAVLESMLGYPHSNGEPNAVVAQEARALLNKDERELSGVVSTAISCLTLYRDPIVAKNTKQSSFRIKDLMNDEAPVSLYLVVRPSDADRVRPLIRLMITQIVRRLTEKMTFSEGRSVAHYKHKLLLLIDEFASLKRLAVIEEALAFIAGYGLKAYLIVQDLQQITAAYGREEALLGNCHIRIAYAPNKIETADLLSRMSGQTTVVRKQTTVSGKRFGYALGQVSESIQEVQRPLITADEVMRLPAAIKDKNDRIIEPGHILVFVAGHAPIYGCQILYFQDPAFNARAKVPAPQISDHTRSLKIEKQPETEFKLV